MSDTPTAVQGEHNLVHRMNPVPGDVFDVLDSGRTHLCRIVLPITFRQSVTRTGDDNFVGITCMKPGDALTEAKITYWFAGDGPLGFALHATVLSDGPWGFFFPRTASPFLRKGTSGAPIPLEEEAGVRLRAIWEKMEYLRNVASLRFSDWAK